MGANRNGAFENMDRHFALRGLMQDHAAKRQALHNVNLAIEDMCGDDVQDALQSRYLALGGVDHGEKWHGLWKVFDADINADIAGSIVFFRKHGYPSAREYVKVEVGEVVNPSYMRINTQHILGKEDR